MGTVRSSSNFESLEQRMLLSADVLSWHNDPASAGQNSAETILTRANVNQTTFGKLFTYSVLGQIYAQPLVKRSVSITSGANAGVHDVVFVATEHDQLYAFDAGTLNGADNPATAGQLLWQRNFLDIANANNHLPSATALTTVPSGDVISSDITVEIGITGTPVIDPASNTLYLITKTKETVAGIAHFVQRVHAINIQDGSDRAVTTIGNTTGTSTYANTTQVYVYGGGVGNVTDPYNGTGRSVVQFNALREFNQAALTLINGVLYAGFGSHGDNPPFHGWMIGWDKNTLALKGVLNTTPAGTSGGIWMGGGSISFDGTYFYAQTGDGTFTPYNGSSTAANPVAPAPGPITGLDANGFPFDANYGDSFLKIGLDPTTTPISQNKNGWGLKVVDYFTPFNEEYLNQRAIEVGSGAPVVLPDSVGSVAHPHLLVGAGMEGVIYLIDRDNMGKFGLQNNIVQNLPNQLSGLLGAPAIFNGQLYFVEGFGGVAKTFTIAASHISNTPTTTSSDPFSFAGSTPSISSSGLADGIAWDIDRGTNQLRAYSSDSYATELYTSAQAINNRDALGAAVKWEVPTVANGHVYAGSGSGDPNNALVVYGLLPPPTAVPADPTNLFGQPASTTQLNLSWTNNAINAPNTADGFYIDQSSDGISNWQPAGIAPQNFFSITGLAPGTTYYFRVRAHDSLGFSNYAYTAAATPAAGAAHSIDFSGGFASSAGLTLNGGATVGGNSLHLTTQVANQARSAFYNTQQNIASFTTKFTYTKNGLADGAAFIIQRDPRAATALGAAGGALGYGSPSPITPSFALGINIYSGHLLGTEFLTNGTVDFNYSQTNINTSLNNTPITIILTYAGGLLNAQLVQGANSETKTFAIDLPALLGGNLAYIGFSGATGSTTATQDITSWSFDSGSPPAIPSQPDLSSLSDSGVSTTDNITNDNTPTLSGISAPGSNVAILQNGLAAGAATTSPSGVFSVTTSALADAVRNITATSTITNGTSTPSSALPVTIDTTPPSLAAPAVFSFNLPPQSIIFNFNEPISVLVGDLTLLNQTISANIPADKMAIQLDAAKQQATWSFPGYNRGILPDGNYHASISAAKISDTAGNHPAADPSLDFFALIGDLNRDRSVTIADFIDLAGNFNKTPATFSQGDMNYDGSVTIADFIDLTGNFNKSLPIPAPSPQAASAVAISTATTKSRPGRHHSRRRYSPLALLTPARK